MLGSCCLGLARTRYAELLEEPRRVAFGRAAASLRPSAGNRPLEEAGAAQPQRAFQQEVRHC